MAWMATESEQMLQYCMIIIIKYNYSLINGFKSQKQGTTQFRYNIRIPEPSSAWHAYVERFMIKLRQMDHMAVSYMKHDQFTHNQYKYGKEGFRGEFKILLPSQMSMLVIVKMQCNKIKTELSEHHPEQQHQNSPNQASRKEEGSTCVDNKQSMTASQQTRITFTYASHPLPHPPSADTIHRVIYQQQDVIYYPVIHNKLLLPPTPTKHPHLTTTATTRRHTPSAHASSTPARKLPPTSDQVLTPQQFRKLSLHTSK